MRCVNNSQYTILIYIYVVVCKAVGAVAFHSRIPEVTAAPILSSIFRWMIRMFQSIHRLRAGKWLRVPWEIGVGKLMFAIRVRKSVAPSENAPVRDIPIRDTVGAPLLLLFKPRNFRIFWIINLYDIFLKLCVYILFMLEVLVLTWTVQKALSRTT